MDRRGHHGLLALRNGQGAILMLGQANAGVSSGMVKISCGQLDE